MGVSLHKSSLMRLGESVGLEPLTHSCAELSFLSFGLFPHSVFGVIWVKPL